MKNNKYLSIKETSMIYGISTWTLYELIKTDKTFPWVNLGIKKRYAIDKFKLEDWISKRSTNYEFYASASADDILKKFA